MRGVFSTLLWPALALASSHAHHARTVSVSASAGFTPDTTGERAAYTAAFPVGAHIRDAMLGSIRTSWEQGAALGGLLEFDAPAYAVFGSSPFAKAPGDPAPYAPLALAVSAVARQGPDGRLSQEIGDATDGAALDGASAGSGVLLGAITDPAKRALFQNASDAQLNFILTKVPRTSTGAISQRIDAKQYWADAIYMGPPFLAYAGAVAHNESLLQLAYDTCRLYRNALLVDGPTGKLWAHLYDDDSQSWWDEGIWATGNAWAATGMLRVLVTIQKSSHAADMKTQVADLLDWTEEILNGTFHALGPDNLIPNYISTSPDSHFGDCSASSALASVFYRLAVLYPQRFSSKSASFYAATARKIRQAVLGNVDELGLLTPVVDPLNWQSVGLVSTEGQAFGLMMVSAWGAWIDAQGW